VVPYGLPTVLSVTGYYGAGSDFSRRGGYQPPADTEEQTFTQSVVPTRDGDMSPPYIFNKL
ncbi:MAG: hypothetical protein ACI3V2_02615, partial [Faecousia sp.]